MKNILLNCKEIDKWNSYLKKIPSVSRNIYASPGYISLYENASDKGYCYICINKEKIFLYPFILRDIPGDKKYKDITTPYGYGGPLTNTNNKDFIKNSFKNLRLEQIKLNVVAELIKFNPFIENKKIIESYDGKLIHDRDIVYVDNKEFKKDDVNISYSKSSKKKINKIIKINKELIFNYGVSEKYLIEFEKIYNSSLDNLKAHKSYYKKKSFYKKLFKFLPKNYIILNLYEKKKLINSQLLIFDELSCHCHMMGSDENAKKNNFVVYAYHKVIKWVNSKGFKILNLGGGRTSNPNDSLLNFKKNFSKRTKKYLIGEKVINKKIYDILCKGATDNKFLFKYR